MDQSLDDSLCILYEKIRPVPEIIDISNADLPESVDLSQSAASPQTTASQQTTASPQTTASNQSSAGDSQNIQQDDSVHVLQERNRAHPEIECVNRISSKEAELRKKKKTKIECGICFDGPDEILESNRTLGSTVCGHIFCNACMATSRQSSALCPTCRKRLGKTQFHPIYF